MAKALGHSARLRILRRLAQTPGCISGDIVDAVGLAQSTVSEHARILRDAGVIEGQIDPPRVCYSPAPGALALLLALITDLETAVKETERSMSARSVPCWVPPSFCVETTGMSGSCAELFLSIVG